MLACSAPQQWHDGWLGISMVEIIPRVNQKTKQVQNYRVQESKGIEQQAKDWCLVKDDYALMHDKVPMHDNR